MHFTYSTKQRPSWQLTGPQLVKKFYGTRRFITALTSARHPSLTWALHFTSISLLSCMHFNFIDTTEFRTFQHERRRHIVWMWGNENSPQAFVHKVSPKDKVWLGELIDQTVGHDALIEKDKRLIAPFTLICCKNSQSYKRMDDQTPSVSQHSDVLPHCRNHAVL
jgi:hypothetical protein